MLSLDIISINFWQMVISLCNLFILFLILKKFLYKPVRQVMAERQAQISRQYADAEEAARQAAHSREEWQGRLDHAQEEADELAEKTARQAKHRSDQIIQEAEVKADDMLRTARSEMALEKKKAGDAMKNQIVEISAMLTEKMLAKTISEEDHRQLISSAVEELGEVNRDDEK